MQKILLSFFLAISLSSCSIFAVHKNDVEQGNVITPRMLSQVHTGMSKTEVTRILGAPVLMNTFAENRLNYVYSYKPGYGSPTIKLINLNFQNNILREINQNSYSEFAK